MMRRNVTFCIWAVAVILGNPVLAQETTATLRGVVVDASKGVVPEAKVTATNTLTGVGRSASTNRDGAYVLPLLPAGPYELTVEAAGFQRYVQKGIALTINQQAVVNVELSVGSRSESVEVMEEASPVNTVQGATGQVIGSTAIHQLPLNGRNYLQLATLQPGIAPQNIAVIEFTPALGGQQGFSANGLRPQSNNFLLDGADNNDGVLGTAAGVPSPDALEEFRILTNAYSAEYGRGGGAVVNVLTRSGTNDVHGSAYDFLRNQVFDARNFFSPGVPPLTQNQFGGTLGGPIRRNRTFFFASYEGFRNKQGVTASATVLSIVERQGDFSRSSSKPRDPTTGQPFPNNSIPLSRISPIAQSLLTLVPAPNAGANQLISTVNGDTNSDQFLLRGDQVMSSRNTLSARYFYQSGVIAKPFTSPPPVNIPGFPYEDEFGFQNGVITDTHTFRPNLLNEARFNFSRIRTVNNHPAYQIDPETMGFRYPGAGNIPTVILSGLTTIGTSVSTDNLRRDNTFQFQEHVTYIRGAHAIRFGADVYRNRFSLRGDTNLNGSFTFSGSTTGSAAADLLLGLPSAFSQGSPGAAAYFHSTFLQPYIQDDIRVTRRLMLNFGLRYELDLPVSEQQDRLIAFRPGLQSHRFPNAPTGLVFQGDPGVGQIVRTEKNNWAPRVGFAWDVFGDGRTSVRGGYGIYYDALLGTLYNNLALTVPFTEVASGTALQNFADPFGGQSPFAGNGAGVFFPQLLSLNAIDGGYTSPYSQQWNLTVERELPRGVVFSAGYLGTRGVHLPGTRVLNTAVFVPGNSTARNVDQRRPYAPAFGQILDFISAFDSNYHSLQLSANKRWSHGLTFLTAYTYGKAIDNASFPTGRLAVRVGTLVQNQNDFRGERGLSNFDQRHRLTFSYVWELPVFRSRNNFAGRLFGGWQLAGVATIQSGSPFIIQDGSDPNLDGVASDRPNVIRNPNLPSGQQTVRRFWDTAAFVRLPSGTNAFGNAGRNIVIGPNDRNFDASLVKGFRLRESANAQFRWEVFNVFNRANFANPSGGSPTNDISSPLFGQITSTLPNSQRIMQLALRVTF
ncbi:MAG: carboxypeptidase regulatory-like domain-containing protein [Bryobacteraceae bacterium]